MGKALLMTCKNRDKIKNRRELDIQNFQENKEKWINVLIMLNG